MLAFLWALSAAVAVAAAIPTISIKGSKFFTSEGKQFYVKGIAYQLLPTDPLIDGAQCAKDAALMKTLGTNAIRVYHVDPTADHKSCMNTFSDNGIYAFIDLETFDTQIVQTAPAWNASQAKAFQKVMDAFHSYDNVAGFFIGNEVLNDPAGSPAAPYVKAAARDMKAYRDAQKYRKIPIGYSAADVASLRPMLQNYLACGPDPSDIIDFFSLNAYEWCGESTYQVSGYSFLTQNVTEYNIPIFFSETGCNTARPRTFADQAAIFGPEMSPYWSGSIIYEWIEEENNYGLISYGAKVDPVNPVAPSGGWPRSGDPTPVSPDFNNLKTQWQKLNPTSISAAAYSPTLTPPKCPDRTSGTWEVDPSAPLPPNPLGSPKPNQGGTTKSSASSLRASATISSTAVVIAAATQTSVVAVTTALGIRSVVPVLLLAAGCWVAVGNFLVL